MTSNQIIDVSELERGAEALGLVLSGRQIAQFVRFAEILEEWNLKMNLTRVPGDSVEALS